MSVLRTRTWVQRVDHVYLAFNAAGYAVVGNPVRRTSAAARDTRSALTNQTLTDLVRMAPIGHRYPLDWMLATKVRKSSSTVAIWVGVQVRVNSSTAWTAGSSTSRTER